MGYEYIALVMFGSLMAMMLTGQRMFGVIGFVAVVAALLLWGERGGYDLAFAQTIKLMNWFPLMTLPMFIFMGYVLSESRLADDLYRMFHVWFGPVPGGLAIGTILLMVLISAMNGLSVAGMAIGATIALPELLKRNYDKRMVTGVIQAGSSLGILVPPSVVMVLYAMIARQPVGQLWLAGILPGLMMAALFILYIWLRCRINPALGPVLSKEERAMVTRAEKLRLLQAGLMPLGIFLVMMVPFIMGYTRLVESSVIGALAAFIILGLRKRTEPDTVYLPGREPSEAEPAGTADAVDDADPDADADSDADVHADEGSGVAAEAKPAAAVDRDAAADTVEDEADVKEPAAVPANVSAAVPATVSAGSASVQHADSAVSDSESRDNLPDNQSGPGRASAPAEASKESTGGTKPATGASAAGTPGHQADGTAPEAEGTK